MKIHDVEQNSVDWQILRSGKVTASEMDALVTPLGKVKTGDGPKSYLMKKLAETWLGGPLPSLNVWDMEQGKILEERAKPAFTLQTGIEVRSVGFITGDDERIGCSPDGLIGDDCGIEIKCPHIEQHIRYLLDGCLPPDYVAQVQGSMFVTGFQSWYFCSFRRNFPLFVLKVERDEKYQDALHDALERFLEALDDGMARLTKLNGGPPPRPKPFAPKPEYASDQNDIPH